MPNTMPDVLIMSLSGCILSKTNVVSPGSEYHINLRVWKATVKLYVVLILESEKLL